MSVSCLATGACNRRIIPNQRWLRRKVIDFKYIFGSLFSLTKALAGGASIVRVSPVTSWQWSTGALHWSYGRRSNSLSLEDSIRAAPVASRDGRPGTNSIAFGTFALTAIGMARSFDIAAWACSGCETLLICTREDHYYSYFVCSFAVPPRPLHLVRWRCGLPSILIIAQSGQGQSASQPWLIFLCLFFDRFN